MRTTESIHIGSWIRSQRPHGSLSRTGPDRTLRRGGLSGRNRFADPLLAYGNGQALSQWEDGGGQWAVGSGRWAVARAARPRLVRGRLPHSSPRSAAHPPSPGTWNLEPETSTQRRGARLPIYGPWPTGGWQAAGRRRALSYGLLSYGLLSYGLWPMACGLVL